MNYDRFHTFVSHETSAPLRTYSELIKKWTERINLIARQDATDEAIWGRHIVDSLQLVALIPEGALSVVDLGSGAGLPGMVVAIERPDLQVTMIEADRRKAAFLQIVVAALGLRATVLAERIERVAMAPADVVMARALAPLPRLLDYAAPLVRPDGVGIFMKGRGVDAELAAVSGWAMRVERFDSVTDEDAKILRISELRRAG